MSAKNKYTSEFKKTIVNLYHSGKSYAQIHNEYGVSSSALFKRVKVVTVGNIPYFNTKFFESETYTYGIYISGNVSMSGQLGRKTSPF